MGIEPTVPFKGTYGFEDREERQPLRHFPKKLEREL